MYTNVKAIVLRAERSGEGDKRLSLLTREKGRVYAVARGAGRPSARLAAATEPCAMSRFRLWAAPGGRTTRVAGGTLENAFTRIRDRWTCLTTALLLCELTDRMTALEQPHPSKFDLLHRALRALEVREEAPVRLAFQMQFLKEAGYALDGDVLGEDVCRRHGRLVAVLSSWDFQTSLGVPERMDRTIQNRLMSFVASYIGSPLKTFTLRQSLDTYIQDKTAAAELAIPAGA